MWPGSQPPLGLLINLLSHWVTNERGVCRRSPGQLSDRYWSITASIFMNNQSYMYTSFSSSRQWQLSTHASLTDLTVMGCLATNNCSISVILQRPEGALGGQPRKRLSSEGMGGATAAKRKPSPIRFEAAPPGAAAQHQKRESQSMYAPPRDRYSKNLANGANFDSYQKGRGRGFRRGRGGFRGRGRKRGSWKESY